jgi:hypothetical protein
MEVICRSLVRPSYQADSLEKTARKQCFRALATTLYGLGHAEESLLYDGRSLYLRALKMVNNSITGSDSLASIETLSSVVALCLHEVREAFVVLHLPLIIMHFRLLHQHNAIIPPGCATSTASNSFLHCKDPCQ